MRIAPLEFPNVAEGCGKFVDMGGCHDVCTVGEGLGDVLTLKEETFTSDGGEESRGEDGDWDSWASRAYALPSQSGDQRADVVDGHVG